MKISTKGRYGIRALIDLAVNSTNGHVSLVNIANRNQISVHYLEHVFSSLKRGGIVKSVKGAQGGYVLADKPENITVAQMILALEGRLQYRAGIGERGCTLRDGVKGDGHAVVGSRERGDEADLREHYAGGSGE